VGRRDDQLGRFRLAEGLGAGARRAGSYGCPDSKEAGKIAAKAVGGNPWSAFGLRKTWNAHKVEDAAWWAENSKECYSSGSAGLATGLSDWQASRSGRRKGKTGFPRFKARGVCTESVTYSTGSFGIADAHHVRVPRLDSDRGPRRDARKRNLLEVSEDLSGYLEAISKGDLMLGYRGTPTGLL
jgi:hypothetical protein